MEKLRIYNSRNYVCLLDTGENAERHPIYNSRNYVCLLDRKSTDFRQHMISYSIGYKNCHSAFFRQGFFLFPKRKAFEEMRTKVCIT